MPDEITRRRLLGSSAAIALTAAVPAMAGPSSLHVLRGGGGTGAGASAPPSQITTATVANVSNNALVAPYVQFYQPIARGDMPDGNVFQIVDDLGGAVTYTAARRADWPDITTNRSGSDLFCKLSNNIAGKIAISSLTISGTTATCTTAVAHGLSTGAKVLIQPQNSDVAVGSPSAQYAGLVAVTVTGASTFTYTVPGATPSGAATVGMEMCYTRTLTLSRTSGSWNDALPAGKTSANILTDIQTNFDNVTIELTNLTNEAGSTVGSGTFQANFTQCIAQAGTDKLRVVATGPTLCDFVGIMKFADTTGGARNPTLAGWFYVSALLNPSTGAVVEIHARAFIDQSLLNIQQQYYTFRSRMKLGTTVVRSLGLSSNAAIDGKVQSFTPSLVNTATSTITIPGHKFTGSERVRFTTTGTLPSGLSANTDYWVIWVDTNNIRISSFNYQTLQFGSASGISLSSQGSGTHTITCWQQSAFCTRMAYVGPDARQDRWTGNSGALAPIGWHVIHNTDYIQRNTKIIPPVDLTVNLVYPVAEVSLNVYTIAGSKGRYVLNSPTLVQFDQGSPGAGSWHEYGAPWTNIPCRRARYPSDIGYCQTLRTSALSIANAYSCVQTRDDTNWRPPVVNRGPTRTGDTYPGMSAPEPNGFLYLNQLYSGWVAPASYTYNNGVDENTTDHRYNLEYPLYTFEGRQEIHDLMIMNAFQFMTHLSNATYSGPGTQLCCRNQQIGSTVYTSYVPGSQARQDGFGLCAGGYAMVLSAASSPERAVLTDYWKDTWIAVDRIINTDGAANDPDWLNFGGWHPDTTQGRGPGVDFFNNSDEMSGLMEGYVGICTSTLYRMCPWPSQFQNCTFHFSRFVDNMYRNVHNSWHSNSFAVRARRGEEDYFTGCGKTITSLTEPMFDSPEIDFLALHMTDGTVWAGYNANYGPFTPPITGEQQWLNEQTPTGGAFVFMPPPELPLSGDRHVWVRQATPNAYGPHKLARTNSDSTIITSYTPYSTSTSSTNIGTGTTSITTSAVLTFYNNAYPYIVISSGAGKEICAINSGRGTTSLSLLRAQYGTTALNHGSGATVYAPYLSGGFRDLQMRDVPFPPAGHAWRMGQGSNAPVEGYRTMARAQAGIWGYLLGIIPHTAYDNANAWFSDPAEDPNSGGPGSFATNNALLHSVNINL